MQILGHADFVDCHDVRMLHARGVLRLAMEALHEIRRRPRARGEDLHRDLAIETDLARAIDDAHAAFADEFDELVVAEPLVQRAGQIHAQGFGRNQCEMAPTHTRRRAERVAEGQIGQLTRSDEDVRACGISRGGSKFFNSPDVHSIAGHSPFRRISCGSARNYKGQEIFDGHLARRCRARSERPTAVPALAQRPVLRRCHGS